MVAKGAAKKISMQTTMREELASSVVELEAELAQLESDMVALETHRGFQSAALEQSITDAESDISRESQSHPCKALATS